MFIIDSNDYVFVTEMQIRNSMDFLDGLFIYTHFNLLNLKPLKRTKLSKC